MAAHILVGIAARALTTDVLLQERATIERIVLSVNHKQASLKNLPLNFTMTDGHLRFFYNKGQYLYKRYFAILAELRKRKVKFREQIVMGHWIDYPPELKNDWSPTDDAIFAARNAWKKKQEKIEAESNEKVLLKKFVGKKIKSVKYDGFYSAAVTFIFTDDSELTIDAEGDDMSHTVITGKLIVQKLKMKA